MRTRLLNLSAMKSAPAASTTTPTGKFRRAWVAGPPSPEKLAWPVPATVVIVPGAAVCWAMPTREPVSAAKATAAKREKAKRRCILLKPPVKAPWAG